MRTDRDSVRQRQTAHTLFRISLRWREGDLSKEERKDCSETALDKNNAPLISHILSFDRFSGAAALQKSCNKNYLSAKRIHPFYIYSSPEHVQHYF